MSSALSALAFGLTDPLCLMSLYWAVNSGIAFGISIYRLSFLKELEVKMQVRAVVTVFTGIVKVD